MDDLTDAQRAELIEDLHALLVTLQQSEASTAVRATTVELDQAAMGRVSRGDAMQAQQMAAAQKRRTELRIKQVKVAMMTIDDDAYGDCKVCGEPIGYARLKARPESPACVSCMAELERNQR